MSTATTARPTASSTPKAAAPSGATSNGAVEEKAPESLRFTRKVEKQFEAATGGAIKWNSFQIALAQHLFAKIDASLKGLDIKRGNNDQKPSITWANVNMDKLAIDAVHVINLEIDALCKNFLHVIPYLNGRTNKYDLDLRLGYDGRLFIHTTKSIDPPDTVVCRLVYETDVFEPLFADMDNDFDTYRFKVTNAFDRGRIVGGFHYRGYTDARHKNKLGLVTAKDLDRSMAAGNAEFWGGYFESGEGEQKIAAQNKSYDQMADKTIKHRLCDQLPLDPRKVNGEAWAAIASSDDEAIIALAEEETAQHANRTPLSIAATAQSVVETPRTVAAVAEKVPVTAADSPAQSDAQKALGVDEEDY